MTIQLKRHRFSVEDYHRLSELGFLDPDGRDELLDGEIVEMPAVREPHAYAVGQCALLFIEAVGRVCWVGVQSPLRLGRYSEPQPDLVVAHGPRERYATNHPEPADVLLVIEVSDASYRKDLVVKLPLYARAGIPEAWIVNLAARRIEVYRAPRRGGYGEVTHAGPGESVSPAAFPNLRIPVDEVLPPA